MNHFYLSKLDRLPEYTPLARARLYEIDDELLEKYIARRVAKKRAPATINFDLGTHRRLLYFAKDARTIIKAVPTFEMLDGERSRDFVLSREMEAHYLEFCNRSAERCCAAGARHRLASRGTG